MIELPEALTLSAQLRESVAGQAVSCVLPPTKEHRFCWFNGDPAAYDERLRGRRIMTAEGFGLFVELVFDSGDRLCLNDGVNIRLTSDPPGDYQLLLYLEGGQALACTVAMYGGLYLHDGSYDNEYYRRSREAVSPFSADFDAYFGGVLAREKQSLSAKALLATGQRFPGIGNGVLQDILLAAGIHPKRKLQTLGEPERAALRAAAVSVLREMTEHGGRDTEKDLYGRPGGYRTRLSRLTLTSGCPLCGGALVKEAYLGGAVYWCPHCQPLPGKTES